MSEMQFEPLDVPSLGPTVRRYSITSAHRASHAVLLPGRKPLGDLVVLDLMLAGHHRRQGCACVPRMPALATAARA